jgi:hypothetical protein
MTSDGSIGSALGLVRLPSGCGEWRDGDEEGWVPDSRLRLLVLRPLSDVGGRRASLRPLRRPEDLCSLSDVNGAGVEGASCLTLRVASLVPATRSGRLSDAIEARDCDLLREASADE